MMALVIAVRTREYDYADSVSLSLLLERSDPQTYFCVLFKCCSTENICKQWDPVQNEGMHAKLGYRSMSLSTSSRSNYTVDLLEFVRPVITNNAQCEILKC